MGLLKFLNQKWVDIARNLYELWSLLLLFLALAALFTFLGEESAFGLEPLPSALDVPGGIVHGHLLFNLGLFCFLFGVLFFFAPLALFRVLIDEVKDLGNLHTSLFSLVLKSVTFILNTGNFGLTRVILLLSLGIKLGNTLVEMTDHLFIDFLLSFQHTFEMVNLLLKFNLSLLVHTVLA